MIAPPTKIILHRKSRILEVVFSDEENFQLPCEYLRVFSPSAETRGKLVLNKKDVTILKIEPIGHYAIKPFFSDGHATGIFSWQMLHDLGVNQAKNWREYQEKVHGS